ncbi:hypothetical protein AFAEC_0350 [Aliarcobacter faecis]|uniref:hypothetical protein n=1 Tax=Aliarcobacter faecis TaxID=1564138 RepID=UPI00047E88AF|nr:hypothetical protein [Aliarcobacter faecis]QKF72559.1 hypothetical protein AFAEC_0350 [Aliarcobacter faecis]
MIFFRVTNNINIKTTDGSLVKYFKFKAPASLPNETVYVSSYDDFSDLNGVFERIDKSKYFTKVLNEENIRANKEFPVELGISTKFEFDIYKNRRVEEFLDLSPVDLYRQVKYLNKDNIKIAIIGGMSSGIGKTIASCTALRILHQKLSEIFKSVKIDLYISASNNSYFSRDKDIYKTQDYLNEILPLGINTKQLCEYDYFIDNSVDFTKLLDLNYVDAWLYKFGIDYKKISDDEKYNYLETKHFNIDNNLKNKISEAKRKGKLLLFHPYSANINKSIPQTIAIDLLKELLLKLEDYTIVTTLQIDPKIKADNLLDLSKESRSINDFIYIISSMDKIITTNTSAFHISDAFMIPTITFFVEDNFETLSKYYKYNKSIYLKDKSKSLSKFIYENEALTIYKLEAWKSLKVSKIIKLLEKI